MRNTNLRHMKGFTLIELMIVIAILGILLAIAIPAYQDYTIRTKAGEGLSVAAGAKLAVTETYQSSGSFPADNDAAGLASATAITGDNVTSVTANSDGTISILYGKQAPAELSGNTLTLSPITFAGSIDWSCRSSNIDTRYLPSQCR